MAREYTKEEKKAWGAEQDRARAARAARAAQGIAPLKPTPAKRASRSKPLIADVGGSVCFDSLVWEDGTVTAQFAKDGSIYEYDMNRKEAKAWFSDDLGEYFNSEVR
jgi:hypothetical protein